MERSLRSNSCAGGKLSQSEGGRGREGGREGGEGVMAKEKTERDRHGA